jgi:hypothetical protein
MGCHLLAHLGHLLAHYVTVALDSMKSTIQAPSRQHWKEGKKGEEEEGKGGRRTTSTSPLLHVELRNETADH